MIQDYLQIIITLLIEQAQKAQQQFEKLTSKMISIPTGSFQMDLNSGSADEKSVHQVNIRTFKLGKYEVTQRQWQVMMSDIPSSVKNCIDCPVEKVSWDDA